MRKQLRLSGSGGQGVITAAIIFAEAAVAEGKQAVQSQSYGPEARGGASKSEVIIDDEKFIIRTLRRPIMFWR
jgi:2-oxoglutarate ferredoxin oxidoreductase, gamma subunit (EC 1.2.7.3)